ncbi:uncharacterized protein TRAVEDRAFT_132023 [Trametes versicolor FP-101664 SS1]|uniref:uncharacterized protein n=1 Tax=Trametes versicolor (strain FP-101664) TaxID=717944 RepID=UPI00046219F9|nr:uncharacterized protein TRAVEDRAFT_132023 [Trametes versicolor FP-101664 SS1]EIW54075.1 hypothetical protein TRAVEDRAFT_132023 [Trametes versicolor FP-101664 SS1]
MSRKAWSKSADDLGQLSASASSPALTPIDTSLHQKIKTYRSDSVSSSIASPSPIPSPSASSLNTNYPFPVISGDISTSPPKNTRLGPPSSNPSPITPPLTPASSTSSHVHSRSHSFTPRLPSKLSAQKSNLMPPSPQRKGSASSESRDPERDKGSVGSGSSSRSPFPFGFGAGGAHAKLSPSAIFMPDGILGQGPSSPTLLAPPTIIEPETGDSKSENRTSQMVYQSGFINRMTDFSPAMLNTRAHHAYMAGGAPAVLVKGWKPFKLVLKGSKLYFYKPPGDRSAAIKELFPTELVAVLEGEGAGELEAEVDLHDSEMDMGGRGGGKGKERDDMRRRRAYWGRGRHPALVLGGAEVEKGTAEALVHEAVFATTFVAPADRSGEDGVGQEDPPEASRYRPEWREFAADIVLSLPSLIGKAVFEAELLRCCTTLLNGADEDTNLEEIRRVEWLAARYIDYHGSAENHQAWDAWQQEAIPNFSPDVSKVGGLPASISMTAMHTPSPLLPPSSGAEESSPDLGAFSPRPGQGRMQSITEAYNEASPQKAGSSPPLPSNASSLSPEALRMALEEEGLSRDVLLSLDPALLARSLFVAQRASLQEVPDNFTADYVLGPGLQEAGSSAPAHQAIIPFTGSDDRPHWLTRLVLIQVLVPEPTSNSHGASAQLHHDRPTSRTHTRSDVISAWTRVGELARRTGDDCSWRAIMAALCARPIARLDKVWKRVDPEALSIVQCWVQILVRGDQPTTTASLAYPWVGDAQREIRAALEKARSGDGDEWVVRYLRDVREQFNAVRTTFALCTKRADLGSAAEFPGVDVLAKHWQALAFEGDGRGLAAKFLRTEQFMSLSSAAEPRRRGIFEPYFWSRMSQQPSIHPLAALLFPEPLPAVSFVNRSQIMRGRLESNSSGLNIQDIRDLRSHLDGERTSQSERPKLGGFDLGGTVIPVYSGELLLLVQPGGDAVPSSRPASRAPSRPPSSAAPDTPSLERSFSRNPSIRVTPGSSHGHGSERKSSMARRNSLPSMSQRTSLVASEVTSERPLRVVVQAGTLDRLVDVLVHGLQGVSVSVADDNGEMPLTDRKTREVRVDMDDFSQVWWNNFRSFLKPQVLFELLRKRYVGAHQAGRPLTSDEISHTVRLRMEVLEIMGEWVAQGGGAQDALDDAGLYDAFLAFLTQPTEHKPLESAASDADSEVCQALKALDLARKTLHMSFLSQTLRPIPRTPAAPESTPDGLGAISYGSDLPDIDQLDAEELVNNLNSMASATLRNVTQEDLFVTADLFEVQSADRTGWFLARDPSSIADEVEIQSMSSYILEVEPSALISELAQDNLYRLLPPAVRSCIRAFGILRKWLVSKLVALRIGIQARQQRMELMLRAIEVCRRRNADIENADVLSTELPCVRSFVESMLTSAVLSIESRSYQRAWLGVAVNRGSGCDTLAAYLARPVLQSLSSRGTLAPDIGWLMEKVLEIISLPDVLEAPAVEPVTLVNFEKRRTLQTLLTSVSGAAAGRRQRRRENDRRDFERLNNMEKELGTVHFDMRTIREDAYRESGQASVTPSKRAQRPFQMLVAQQQEKNRRDRVWRDRLSKEKRQEQLKNDRREEQLNKAMHQRRQNPVMPKQHRNKKSMSSAFFQFMRPISSAFTSDTMSGSPAKRWTPAELDFAPSHKPSLVLSVVGARVAHFINNERSFVFQIDSEDGGHYLLQAASQQEMKKWTETIERVSKMTAKRRLTYLGQNTKPQLAEHLLTKPAVATRDPYAVFGVELDFLLQRECPEDEVPAGTVPAVLERLINEVEQRGLTEVGIYRIAGAHSEVNTLRDALNRGEWPISELTDIHAVCDLIKSWFRVLPGGLFPADTYGAILNAAATGRDDVDLQTKVANVREIVHTLPGANFDLLKRIVEHLERVTDYEESNQMTTESLATVFSPNLLRSTNSDVGTFFSNMAAGHRVTKMLIAHFHVIFDNDIEQEQDADADAEQEAEECDFDEPILEEDEEEEDLFRDSVDELPPKLPSEPPVLNINLGSPASLSFNMP